MKIQESVFLTDRFTSEQNWPFLSFKYKSRIFVFENSKTVEKCFTPEIYLKLETPIFPIEKQLLVNQEKIMQWTETP